MIRSRKYLAAAKGHDCTMQIPGYCNSNPETVVSAHSNLGRHGKGMGLKSDDVWVAYACSICHGIYDGHIKTDYSRDELQEFWQRGFEKTLLSNIERGIIRLP